MEPSTTATTTPDNDVAQIVARVAGKAQEWQALPLPGKVELLQQILTNAIRFEPEWNSVAFAARGIKNNNKNGNTRDIEDDRQGCARADTMTVGPATLGAYLNGLIASLQHGNNNGMMMMMMMPPPPLATRIVNSNDDCDEKTCTKTTRIVTVWPRTWLDKLEAVGLRGELVVTVVKDDDDDDSSTLSTTTTNITNNNKSLQMSFEESIKNGGGVAAILGAGNVNAPIEVLCEMFLHGRVVVYKPNPVNQAQVQVLSRIFKPLVAAGYLEFVVGDDASVVVVGAALVSDARVNRIVLTGSAATLEKIKPLIHNKTRRNETTTPSICAELGGVNPWIVVPCDNDLVDSWDERSIDVHARHLAFAKMTNNGHTCAAPQVVILARDWPHRPGFINRVRYWLAAYAGNAPFYPGSDKTYARFAAWPNAEIILPAAAGINNNNKRMKDVFEKQQHPILITNVDMNDASQKDVFELEAFCPVLAEVPIKCNSTNSSDEQQEHSFHYYSLAFLKSAIQVAEEKCFGSLTANIIIPDRVVKSYKLGEPEFDKILSKLSFGIVGVNVWPALAHSMPMLAWGAPPGHEQSGSGFLGNVDLYRNVQKTILRAPFHNWLGMRAVSVMSSPRKTERVFKRFATYKLKPSLVSQSMLFAALFLGI